MLFQHITKPQNFLKSISINSLILAVDIHKSFLNMLIFTNHFLTCYYKTLSTIMFIDNNDLFILM